MSCSNITQGISKGCNNNLGGIRNIYISEQPITGYVLSNGIIASFSPQPTWLTVEADQGTGNFTETYEINQMGGIVAFKQSVTFQINDLSAYNQQRIQELAESTNLGCVVEMNNSTFYTCGIERGAYLETGSTSSGTAYGDLSGSTITITGMEQISSLEVSPVAIQFDEIVLTKAWVENLTCFGSAGTYHYFNNLVITDAKCEYNACNAYIQADTKGCYPSTLGVQFQAKGFKIIPGSVIGVGLQLYEYSSGLPSTRNESFWYPQGGNIDNGSYYQLNPDYILGTITNGVITEFTNQSNITC